MKLAVFVVAVFYVRGECEAVIFSKCDLARKRRSLDFEENLLPDWLCLVKHESGYSTSAININVDGSRDLGLFQINDRSWCGDTSATASDYNVTCADLLSADITKAAQIAQKIYKLQGFQAWRGWLNHCQGVTLPKVKC